MRFGTPDDVIRYVQSTLLQVEGMIAAAAAAGTVAVPGKSAYQLAVERGFQGDEAAWLASLHGQDGVPPNAAELRALIADMVPQPERGLDGHTPTAEELRALIAPLIPAPIAGHTPTNAELLQLITPLIPAPQRGEPGPACSLSIDSVTTGAPGSAAAAAIAGAAPNQRLSLTIPRGDPGAAAVFSAGAPTQRPVSGAGALALGAAYQALTPAKAAEITVNLSSTAVLTLTGGAVPEAELVIAPNAALAQSGAAGSFKVGRYRNGLTTTVAVAFSLSAPNVSQLRALLPAGWWWCVRLVAGTVTFDSVFDQAIG